jgi:hypothetical protein
VLGSALVSVGCIDPKIPEEQTALVARARACVTVSDAAPIRGQDADTLYVSVMARNVPSAKHQGCPPDTVKCGRSCCDFDSVCVNGGCCVPPHCPLVTQ